MHSAESEYIWPKHILVGGNDDVYVWTRVLMIFNRREYLGDWRGRVECIKSCSFINALIGSRPHRFSADLRSLASELSINRWSCLTVNYNKSIWKRKDEEQKVRLSMCESSWIEKRNQVFKRGVVWGGNARASWARGCSLTIQIYECGEVSQSSPSCSFLKDKYFDNST